MKEVQDAWIPQEMHGELQLPNGKDAEKLIKRAIRKFQVPAYDDIQFYIKINMDGSRSLFFELIV